MIKRNLFVISMLVAGSYSTSMPVTTSSAESTTSTVGASVSTSTSANGHGHGSTSALSAQEFARAELQRQLEFQQAELQLEHQAHLRELEFELAEAALMLEFCDWNCVNTCIGASTDMFMKAACLEVCGCYEGDYSHHQTASYAVPSNSLQAIYAQNKAAPMSFYSEPVVPLPEFDVSQLQLESQGLVDSAHQLSHESSKTTCPGAVETQISTTDLLGSLSPSVKEAMIEQVLAQIFAQAAHSAVHGTQATHFTTSSQTIAQDFNGEIKSVVDQEWAHVNGKESCGCTQKDVPHTHDEVVVHDEILIQPTMEELPAYHGHIEVPQAEVAQETTHTSTDSLTVITAIHQPLPQTEQVQAELVFTETHSEVVETKEKEIHHAPAPAPAPVSEPLPTHDTPMTGVDTVPAPVAIHEEDIHDPMTGTDPRTWSPDVHVEEPAQVAQEEVVEEPTLSTDTNAQASVHEAAILVDPVFVGGEGSVLKFDDQVTMLEPHEQVPVEEPAKETCPHAEPVCGYSAADKAAHMDKMSQRLQSELNLFKQDLLTELKAAIAAEIDAQWGAHVQEQTDVYHEVAHVSPEIHAKPEYHFDPSTITSSEAQVQPEIYAKPEYQWVPEAEAQIAQTQPEIYAKPEYQLVPEAEAQIAQTQPEIYAKPEYHFVPETLGEAVIQETAVQQEAHVHEVHVDAQGEVHEVHVEEAAAAQADVHTHSQEVVEEQVIQTKVADQTKEAIVHAETAHATKEVVVETSTAAVAGHEDHVHEVVQEEVAVHDSVHVEEAVAQEAAGTEVHVETHTHQEEVHTQTQAAVETHTHTHEATTAEQQSLQIPLEIPEIQIQPPVYHTQCVPSGDLSAIPSVSVETSHWEVAPSVYIDEHGQQQVGTTQKIVRETITSIEHASICPEPSLYFVEYEAFTGVDARGQINQVTTVVIETTIDTLQGRQVITEVETTTIDDVHVEPPVPEVRPTYEKTIVDPVEHSAPATKEEDVTTTQVEEVTTVEGQEVHKDTTTTTTHTTSKEAVKEVAGTVTIEKAPEISTVSTSTVSETKAADAAAHAETKTTTTTVAHSEEHMAEEVVLPIADTEVIAEAHTHKESTKTTTVSTSTSAQTDLTKTQKEEVHKATTAPIGSAEPVKVEEISTTRTGVTKEATTKEAAVDQEVVGTLKATETKVETKVEKTSTVQVDAAPATKEAQVQTCSADHVDAGAHTTATATTTSTSAATKSATSTTTTTQTSQWEAYQKALWDLEMQKMMLEAAEDRAEWELSNQYREIQLLGARATYQQELDLLLAEQEIERQQRAAEKELLLREFQIQQDFAHPYQATHIQQQQTIELAELKADWAREDAKFTQEQQQFNLAYQEAQAKSALQGYNHIHTQPVQVRAAVDATAANHAKQMEASKQEAGLALGVTIHQLAKHLACDITCVDQCTMFFTTLEEKSTCLEFCGCFSETSVQNGQSTTTAATSPVIEQAVAYDWNNYHYFSFFGAHQSGIKGVAMVAAFLLAGIAAFFFLTQKKGKKEVMVGGNDEESLHQPLLA